MYHLSIRNDLIKDIVETTRAALDQCYEIDHIVRDLPPVSVETVGKLGVEQRERKLAEYEQKQADILEKAKAKIAPLISEFRVDIDAQTTPSGEEVEKNKDYMLFVYNLITSPEQLSRLIEKNHSLLFALTAEKYAAAAFREWKGFDVTTDEDAVRSMADMIERICSEALESYKGYYAFYVRENDFIYHIAEANGLLESVDPLLMHDPEASDGLGTQRDTFDDGADTAAREI